MKKLKLKLYIIKLFTSDELPFEERILNFVCFLGAGISVISLIARIIEGMPFITISTMYIMLAALLGLFCASARHFKHMNLIMTVILFGLGIAFFPILYFTNGGADSGMAAYFALVIILQFLLMKGKTRVAALICTTAATVFTYYATLFLDWGVLPVGGMNDFQRFVDNMQSIFLVGFFMGTVIVFQNGVYLKEKSKAEAAGSEMLRSEELLTLVNEAAALLLTAEPDKFNTALNESMGKMATCVDIDCVFIWRAGAQDEKPVYKLLHGWTSPVIDKSKTFEEVSGSDTIPRMPEWDDKLFGDRGYMCDTADKFSGFIYKTLSASGIKAILGFPVFFHGKYWGFVSFENRHSDRLCSEREAAILQSGSLLLANAVERNDNMLQMNERFAQQHLMSDISKSFITKEPMDTLIQAALARMGKFLNVVRVIVAVFEKDSEISRPGYFWFAEQKYAPNASQKGFSGIIKELFPRYHSEGADNPAIYCDNTLTYKDGKFKLFYERGGLKSMICAPIYVEGELWGVMSIEEHERFRSWNQNDAQLVSMVSSAISSAVARDVMEKERTGALEQALAASRAKGDFLSNMSHEIRTPMNAIIGMTAIGKASHITEKKDYAFNKIDDASKHLLGVINNILDMSKIEANKLELTDFNFEFEKMLQNVVDVINFRVDEKRQKLYVNIDDRIPQNLIGDDQRLSQVIINLMSNAVKFTPDEGVIRLDARLLSEENDGCRLQIEVTDTGIGINDEQKARLFQAFEQAEAGTSRKYGGTGLGLVISKRIVELMNGTIRVESDPGRGSKFIFDIMLRRGSGERRRLADNINLNNIRIFAVDDEPEIREFFIDVSASLGITCEVASGGEEAFEKLSFDDNFNIYFLDWKLPGMNGVELARKIREKQRSDSNSVVILFSSADWSAINEDANNTDIDKFLPKPLFKSTVVDIINEFINNNRVSQQDDIEAKYDDYSKNTILLTEDVEINREIVITLLEPTGLHIECAENGAVAVEMFKNAPDRYDMIFMDVQMPEMDGYEATRRIRAMDHPRAGIIPIVAMTANVFREDIERCLDSGMNAHIGKPIDTDEVFSMLNKYMSN